MPTQKPTARLSPLESRVLETVRACDMIAPGDYVLVAVSGGADSVALLLCLRTLSPILDCRLAVAHLNHCLRGEEGDGDEAFVRRLSENLELPYFPGKVDVKAEASAGKQNLEQAAREVRYAFLHRTAEKAAAQKIAVGHNRNDQMETVLFRFLRGSGIEGLSAIHPVVEGKIIRPLMECTRAGILDYLERKRCTYREDSSNGDLHYSRNRIRRELVPYLEKHFNPNLGLTLAREASLMRETWDFIESNARVSFEQTSRTVGNSVLFSVPAINALHPALKKEVIRYGLKLCRGGLRGITRAHAEALLALCGNGQSGRRVMLPDGAVAVRQFDELLLSSSVEETVDYRYELEIPGSCYVPEAQARFHAEIRRDTVPAGNMDYGSRACFELSALQIPLTVRSRAAGDRYGGYPHRKVKKMLIDKKVPLIQRNALPMVVSNGNVIWIPGFRPAKHYAARSTSKTYVMIDFKRDRA